MATKFNDAFWKWFGDSKVVDAKGDPLVVYHGTALRGRDVRSVFSRSAKSRNTARSLLGFLFAREEGVAAAFASARSEDGFGRASIVSAYLRIENPFYTAPRDIPKTAQEVQGLRGKLLSLGHDGIIFYHGDSYEEYIVFDSRQIKSATGNDGTWDGDDADIRSNPPSKSKLEELFAISTVAREGFFREFGLCRSSGNCEEMSEHLYNELVAESYDPVLVAGQFKVSNRKGDSREHTWIEVDGAIIDISADQFGQKFPPVWVNAPKSHYIENRRYYH